MINMNRVGKWIAEDGVLGEPDPSNLYRYVGNSPTNWTDPTGLAAIPGGTKKNLPEKGLLDYTSALFSLAQSREAILTGIPRYGKENILDADRIREKKRMDIGTAEGFKGVVPDDFVLGIGGAFPCVGVILIPPGGRGGANKKKPTFAFHFSPMSNPGGALREFGIRACDVVGGIPPPELTGYKAIICGAGKQANEDDDVGVRMLLGEVITQLKAHGFEIRAYVSAGDVHVDNIGNLYWTTPPTTSTEPYIR